MIHGERFWDRLESMGRGAAQAVGECFYRPIPEVVPPTEWAPALDEVDALYGMDGSEAGVLDDLAALTALHGPWGAAQALFNPTVEASDVA